MEEDEKELLKEKPENKIILNIKRYIFWLDKNIENNENQKYLGQLKREFPNYEIQTFSSVKSAISKLKKEKKVYDFKLIYFIINEGLAEKFFNKYNLLSKTTIIAATIVFCSNINFHSSKPYTDDFYI